MYIIPIILLLVSVTTTAPTTDLSVRHRLQKRAPTCYATDSALSFPPNEQDCIAALKLMPTTAMPGASAGAAASADLFGHFSNAGWDGSPFKLPRWFRANTCVIGVSMISALPHHAEFSSWNAIQGKAVDIGRECLLRRAPSARGGTNKAGRSDGILIEMFGTHVTNQRFVGSLGPAGSGSASRVQ